MNNFMRIMAFSVLCAMAGAANAASGSEVLEARYQAALNDMVQATKKAPDASLKRAQLEKFIGHMTEGLQKAESLDGLSPADKATLHSLLGKYRDYRAELEGQAGFHRVPDSNLDAFAGYVREEMEQAPIGGGIYISSGVLIVILILVILLA